MPVTRIVHDTPYCRIVLRDSPRTIVVFSAVNYPVGKFAASRALENTDCNVVFLNCPHNSWYLEGVPGLGESPESSVAALLALLAGFGLTDDRRVVWGSSMGGYGAVIYGALMGAEVVVASGAVLKLFAPGSLSLTYLKVAGKREDLRLPDVRQLVAGARGRFFLYAGEFYYPDLAAVLPLMDLPNVSVTTLADFGHWLPNYFDGRYGLQRFVVFHLDEGRVFPFEDQETGDLKNWSEYWDLLDQGALEWKDPQRTQLLEQARQSTDPTWIMHCRNALSLGATKSGLHARAIPQAEKALKACPDSRHATRRLVLALRKSGAPPAEWLEVAMGIRDLNCPHVFEPAVKLLESMARAFVDTGRVEQGVDFLRKLMLMENTIPEMKMWLHKLMESLAGYRTWNVTFSEEAGTLLPARALSNTQITTLGGESSIAGVMVFPNGWGKSINLEAENGIILQSDLRLPSPKIEKLHPDLPQAAQARFKIDVRLDDADFATLYASGPDGSRLPVISFNRLPKGGG